MDGRGELNLDGGVRAECENDCVMPPVLESGPPRVDCVDLMLLGDLHHVGDAEVAANGAAGRAERWWERTQSTNQRSWAEETRHLA